MDATPQPGLDTGPRRLQRSRGKDARLPASAVYVGRPTRWGNPFAVVSGRGLGAGPGLWRAEGLGVTGPAWRTSKAAARADAVELFALHTGVLGLHEYDRDALTELRAQLRGKHLACWCPLTDGAGNPSRCHADILLELANS